MTKDEKCVHDRNERPSLLAVVDQVIEFSAQDKVNLGDVFKSVGKSGFYPVLLLAALAVATPLSGVPLFSSLMGIMIFLISAQLLLQKSHLWLPDWVLRKSVSGQLVGKAFRRVRPVVNWIESHTHKRLTWIARRPLVFLPQIACALSGMVMPILEFIPFTSSILGIGVALLALGMMLRDGFVILLGLLPYMGVVWLILRYST